MAQIRIELAKTFNGNETIYPAVKASDDKGRTFVGNFSIPDNQFLYALTFAGSDVKLNIMLPEPGGRMNDNYAAEITIPRYTSLSGQEISDVVKVVESQLMQYKERGNLDRAKLDALCQTVYPDAAPAWPMAKAGAPMALKKFGRGTDDTNFARLMDDIWVPAYENYSTILFFNTDSGIMERGTVEDITFKPAGDFYIVGRINVEEDCQVIAGGMPYDGHPFISRTPNVRIVLRKAGYVDCIFDTQAAPVINLGTPQWLRAITPEMIVPKTLKGEVVNGCSILVNGRPLPFAVPAGTTEVDININKAGFEVVNIRKSVDDVMGRVVVAMTPKVDEISFPVSGSCSNWPGKVSVSYLKGYGEQVYGSPIKGYKEKSGKLVFDNASYVKKTVLFIALPVALLIGLVAGGAAGYFIGDSSDTTIVSPAPVRGNDNQDKLQPDNKEENINEGVSKQAVAKANAYLFNNKVWKLEMMEKAAEYEGLLDGLFAALNTFEISDIRDISQRLGRNSKLEEIANGLEAIIRDGGQLPHKYNQLDADHTITIVSDDTSKEYLNVVRRISFAEPKAAPQAAPQSQSRPKQDQATRQQAPAQPQAPQAPAQESKPKKDKGGMSLAD